MDPSGDPEPLKELLEAIHGGDATALGRLYDLTSPTLYRVLLRMLRRPEAAHEALQDCYIRVWQRSVTYDAAKGHPIRWLIGIARYRALDLLQGEQLRISRFAEDDDCLLDIPDAAPGPLQLAIEQQGIERLIVCLRTLSQMQRKAFLLAYYRGYTHPELAQALNAPLGTVKAWLRRGLARLQDCLGQ